MNEKTQRRLAAIVSADVVGYSRLMGVDEVGTLASLRNHRAELIDSKIAEHDGRIVKTMGDGLLLEFPSVVNAVKCAIEMQEGMLTRNSEVNENKRIIFRIGVNQGDVIIDGEDIHGDGVNLAARLQEIAAPGGISISRRVLEDVRDRLEAPFENTGDQTLKNIARPVEVWRWAPDDTSEVQSATADKPSPLPNKPSIAVLPFTNMSGDPEQEFFADGMAEDIITALSTVNDLLVVARNSTFTYKGQAVDVKQVSREQGVRYVLEGSVRKAGNRVRINTQLIDATTGHHIWAERYDRDLDDIFAIQDEITREVIVILDVRLRAGEQARFWSDGTKILEAWEFVRLAIDIQNLSTPESQRESRPLCKKALEIDPNYATAWVILGWAYHNEFAVGVGHGTQKDQASALDTALDCSKKALELDPSCANAYALSGSCQLSKGEHDLAIAMLEKAIMLSPNHAENIAVSANVLIKSGRPERALELIRKAMRLCPIYPGWFLWVLGTAYRLTGQTHSAIGAFEAAIKRSPDYLGIHAGLASTLGELSRTADAKKPVSDILRLDPDFSIKEYMAGMSYRDPAEMNRFENGLREAGLPD
jgi:adenylate cyclase